MSSSGNKSVFCLVTQKSLDYDLSTPSEVSGNTQEIVHQSADSDTMICQTPLFEANTQLAVSGVSQDSTGPPDTLLKAVDKGSKYEDDPLGKT